ncbi:MAG: formamidopyrimidine-DNA glycosylase [Planctomycetes bacterium]|nr:formamidopyrimidine-DNA glycosylase [Planctomycetota bacterium]
MPELPDITVYVAHLERRLVGATLEKIRLENAFLLRSVEPKLAEFEGQRVVGVERLGKRIVLAFDGELFLVLHLMIAGRLHWKARGAKLQKRLALAAFDFDVGTLVLTEAGSKRRASLHAVRGRSALAEHDPGGIDVLVADLAEFTRVLRSRNHTLKRSLTDPTLFSGIGNAYSDEILHRARLSPLRLTSKLETSEVARLHDAVRETLALWIRRLTDETGNEFPEKVTAFRTDMAVHGKHGKPCPDCGAPVQRVAYADRECNYCARCQNEGRLLADRALSRLLKDDWPRTLDELEALRRTHGKG